MSVTSLRKICSQLGIYRDRDRDRDSRSRFHQSRCVSVSVSVSAGHDRSRSTAACLGLGLDHSQKLNGFIKLLYKHHEHVSFAIRNLLITIYDAVINIIQILEQF